MLKSSKKTQPFAEESVLLCIQGTGRVFVCRLTTRNTGLSFDPFFGCQTVLELLEEIDGWDQEKRERGRREEARRLGEDLIENHMLNTSRGFVAGLLKDEKSRKAGKGWTAGESIGVSEAGSFRGLVSRVLAFYGA